jgi:hypothetical protein
LPAADRKGFVSFNSTEPELGRETAHRIGASPENLAAMGNKWSLGYALGDASSEDIVRTPQLGFCSHPEGGISPARAQKFPTQALWNTWQRAEDRIF